jgi:hypothetical protein
MIYVFSAVFPIISIALAIWIAVATVKYVSTAFKTEGKAMT